MNTILNQKIPVLIFGGSFLGSALVPILRWIGRLIFEHIKSKDESRVYISKIQFDYEYKMFQEIMANLMKVTTGYVNLIHMNSDSYRSINDFIKARDTASRDLLVNGNALRDTMFKYAAFIYRDGYLILRDLSTRYSLAIQDIPADAFESPYSLESIQKFEDSCIDLVDKSEAFIDSVRYHFDKMEIINN